MGQLPWLLRLLTSFDTIELVTPRTDQYSLWLKERAQNLGGYNQLASLLWAWPWFMFFLCIRDLWYKHSSRRYKTWGKDADKLQEECFTSVGGLIFLVWSQYILLHRNGDCGVVNTRACLEGWPILPMNGSMRLYYMAELGWYFHLLIKHEIGMGLKDEPTMVAHHCLSILLLLISYCLSLHHLGILTLGLLNISNPLLHMSKTANLLQLRRMRTALFALFAVAFFISRVVLFPLTVIKCTAWESITAVPDTWQHYRAIYVVGNLLLVALYSMQVLWMNLVIRTLKRVAKGADPTRLEAAGQAHNAGEGAAGSPDKTKAAAAAAAATAGTTAAATAGLPHISLEARAAAAPEKRSRSFVMAMREPAHLAQNTINR